ncbi:hypothetical protein chiPu_0014829 [Chiloscyllium punctatum]|uniref:Uncharacterized protein n=1 Tax=Chiloscyllium punctatum TaxID=137246 RepID=A0A401T130_CHIPU|nr:hypothetical protein [Chiloscyllium punctatum]
MDDCSVRIEIKYRGVLFDQFCALHRNVFAQLDRQKEDDTDYIISNDELSMYYEDKAVPASSSGEEPRKDISNQEQPGDKDIFHEG